MWLVSAGHLSRSIGPLRRTQRKRFFLRASDLYSRLQRVVRAPVCRRVKVAVEHLPYNQHMELVDHLVQERLREVAHDSRFLLKGVGVVEASKLTKAVYIAEGHTNVLYCSQGHDGQSSVGNRGTRERGSSLMSHIITDTIFVGTSGHRHNQHGVCEAEALSTTNRMHGICKQTSS